MTRFSWFLDSCQLTLTWLAHITLNYWQPPDGPAQCKRSFISKLECVTYYCYIHVRVTSPVPQKATRKHFAGPKIFIKLPYPPYSHFFIIIVSKHEYSFKKSITLLQKKNSWIIFFKDKQHSTPQKAKDDCICNIEICLYQDVWTHDCCILMRQGETNSPSKARLNQLLDTGLGKAHLSITKNAGDIVLCPALEDNFPSSKGQEGLNSSVSKRGRHTRPTVSCLPWYICKYDSQVWLRHFTPPCSGGEMSPKSWIVYLS